MTERFMVDDSGTLIDMQTRDMFDIVEEVCPLLNELHEENQRLRSTNQKQAELFGVQVEKMIKETDDFLKEALDRVRKTEYK